MQSGSRLVAAGHCGNEMHFAVGPDGCAQPAILHGAIDRDGPAGPDASFIDDSVGNTWETLIQGRDKLSHRFALHVDDLLAVGE